MEGKSKIFVTGATGNQGGAVARHLASHNFHVLALTRNPESVKGRELRSQGMEIVKGDLNDPLSYEQYLKDVNGIFSVQTFTGGVNKEIRQGIMLADTAKKHNIDHLVYSSVICADCKTGIPHWDSKFIIEEHIRNTGINHTIIRPSSLYENLLIPQVSRGILKGKFASPLNVNTKQYMVAADDIGRFCAEVFMNPQLYQQNIYNLATEFMDPGEVASILSGTLGRKVTYQKLPPIVTRLFLGKKLYRMFRWVDLEYKHFAESIEKNRETGNLSLAGWAEKNIKS